MQSDSLFHVRIHAHRHVPWLIDSGLPQILIEHIRLLRVHGDIRLFAFCILPDHVHLLMQAASRAQLSRSIRLFKRHSMADIMRVQRYSLQSSLQPAHGQDALTTNAIRWRRGFHADLVQTDEERRNAYTYIQYNAQYHALLERGQDWPWSSLHFPHMLDGMIHSDRNGFLS
ncbi:MAG: hypothetical protein JWM56_1307 [Candidatus Peribacteria bacterium]|nr:hypothetical protein [Candidatus Peribacteria bacterium]